MHFLWSVFLKAAIFLSPPDGCSFLLAGALTHSRLSLAPCGHSLPCWGLHSPHRPTSSGFQFSCLAALSLMPCGHPPQPACALAPHAQCLFSDVTGLWHTVLGHWMYGLCPHSSWTLTPMAESHAKCVHSPYSLASDTSHWAATPRRHSSLCLGLDPPRQTTPWGKIPPRHPSSPAHSGSDTLCLAALLLTLPILPGRSTLLWRTTAPPTTPGTDAHVGGLLLMFSKGRGRRRAKRLIKVLSWNCALKCFI